MGRHPKSLRDELIALFPERCRKGEGYPGQVGLVCANILAFVHDLEINVDAGDLSHKEAVDCGESLAAKVDGNCQSGPRYYATSSSLKCGSDAGNFYNYRSFQKMPVPLSKWLR